MKQTTIFVILVVLAGNLLGCANSMYSWSYSPLIEAYSEKLDQISLGMSKKEVKAILPDAHTRGQTYVGDKIVEALELQHNYWSGVGGSLIKDFMWFYFYEDRLVKWGKPNDWPREADLIIEKRNR